MTNIDLPEEAIKRSADILVAAAKLQNWCVSAFPYACTGNKKMKGDMLVCGCGCSIKVGTSACKPLKHISTEIDLPSS